MMSKAVSPKKVFYIKVNCILKVIIQQILLIINYAVWRKYSELFSNEVIRLRTVK